MNGQMQFLSFMGSLSINTELLKLTADFPASVCLSVCITAGIMTGSFYSVSTLLNQMIMACYEVKKHTNDLWSVGGESQWLWWFFNCIILQDTLKTDDWRPRTRDLGVAFCHLSLTVLFPVLPQSFCICFSLTATRTGKDLESFPEGQVHQLHCCSHCLLYWREKRVTKRGSQFSVDLCVHPQLLSHFKGYGWNGIADTNQVKEHNITKKLCQLLQMSTQTYPLQPCLKHVFAPFSCFFLPFMIKMYIKWGGWKLGDWR